jgi:hypothetical protein
MLRAKRSLTSTKLRNNRCRPSARPEAFAGTARKFYKTGRKEIEMVHPSKTMRRFLRRLAVEVDPEFARQAERCVIAALEAGETESEFLESLRASFEEEESASHLKVVK